MFGPIPYIDWIRGRPAAAEHDLGSSDLRRSDGDGVVPPALRDVPDPDGASLEAMVAEEYGVAPENVLLTPGATAANILVAATALDRGDRVAVERPGYDPLVETPRALGAEVHRFDRSRREAYVLEPDRMAETIGGRTELVVASNRHNPTGALADRSTLSAAAERVAAAGGLLHVDEVYAPYVTDPVGQRAFGGPTAAGLPSTVVTGSLTKFHGFGGLRVGWLVGPAPFLERARGTATHFPAVAEPSRALARRFFAARDRLVEEARGRLVEYHGALAAFVDEREDLAGRVPDGSSYCFVRPSVGGDELAAAARERDLLVVPGRFFDDPGGVRLSLGATGSRRALPVLGEVLDDVSGGTD